MSFFFGLISYVVIIGILDAKLPWPQADTPKGQR